MLTNTRYTPYTVGEAKKLKFFFHFFSNNYTNNNNKMSTTTIDKSTTDNEFQMKDPLIEDEYDDVTTDEVPKVVVKREKKPKLSTKYENYMTFGYWFVTKHVELDNKDPLIQNLKIKSDLPQQTEFYSEFVDNIKNHKKEVKEYIKPKKVNNKKKIVQNNPVEPIVDQHIQLALTDDKPKKVRSKKVKKLEEQQPVQEQPVPLQEEVKIVEKIQPVEVPTNDTQVSTITQEVPQEDKKVKKIKKVKTDEVN